MNDQVELNFPNLLDSVKKEDFKTLLLYLQDGKFLNDQDDKGNTPLITACETNQTKLVDIIMSMGVQVELANNSNETAITVAAQVGNLSMVELLVAFNANYDHQDEGGRTPLMHAIMIKNMEIMQFLIGKGADLELVDKFGMTALMYSLKYFGQKQMEDLLDDSKKALLQKQVTQLEEKLNQRQETSEVAKQESSSEESSKLTVKEESNSSTPSSSIKIIDPDSKDEYPNHSEKNGGSQEGASFARNPIIENEDETTLIKGNSNTSKTKKESNSPDILDADSLDVEPDSIKLSGTLNGKEEESSENIISKSKGAANQEDKNNSLFSSKNSTKNLKVENEGNTTIKSLEKGDLGNSDKLSSTIKKASNLQEIEAKVVKAFEQVPQATKKKRSLKNLKKNEFNLKDFSTSISNMTDHLDSNGEKSLLKGNRSGGFQEDSGSNLNGKSLGSNSKEEKTLVKGGQEGADSKTSDSNLSSKNIINEVTQKIESGEKKVVSSDDFSESEQKEKVAPSSIEIESKIEMNDKNNSNKNLELENPTSASTSRTDSNEEAENGPENMVNDFNIEEKTELKSTGVEEAISTKQGTKVDNSELIKDKDDAFMKHEREREAINEKQKFALKKDDLNLEEDEKASTIKGKVGPQEKEKRTIINGAIQNQENTKEMLKGSIQKLDPVLVITDPKDDEKEVLESPKIDLGAKLGFPKEKVNETNKRGQSHLMVAAGKGDLDKILLLLDNEADSSMKDFNGFTALMFAAQSGHTDIVKTLASKKDDLDVKNAKEFTALSLAVLKDQPECISALIEAGAKKDIKIKGETLLTLAVSKDASKAIKILVTLGLDPLEKNRKGKSAVEMAKKLKKKKVIAFFNKYMANLMK